ncbi:MAG: sulfur carrier protein ThiS [Candidatus Dormiibacterota bacterium]
MEALRVNGRQVELAAPTGLLDYLGSLGLDARAVAVELNGEIVQRPEYGQRTLAAGDTVEIVRMVGGGGCVAR